MQGTGYLFQLETCGAAPRKLRATQGHEREETANPKGVCQSLCQNNQRRRQFLQGWLYGLKREV